MWMLDRVNGCVWKLRPQRLGEAVGHRDWMTDGVTIGYHGKRDGDAFYGFIRYDNTDNVEVPFPLYSHYFHSNTPGLIVADGRQRGLTPYVLLCRFSAGEASKVHAGCASIAAAGTSSISIFTPASRPTAVRCFSLPIRVAMASCFWPKSCSLEDLPTLEQVSAAVTQS